MDTQTVLDRHMVAFGAGDADALAADYADDAVVINQQAVTVGRDAIRDAFARVFSGPFAPGTYEFVLDLATVEGDLAYITWHATCANFDIAFGTDTFIVKDGQIVAQTYGLNIVQK
jgi:uncharacterized protein (TIGR02246 family)